MMTMLLVVLAVLTVVAAGEFVRAQCKRMVAPAVVVPDAAPQLAD